MTPINALPTRSLLLPTSRSSSIRLENKPSMNFCAKTPGCLGFKLLIASTAFRAYRNRHLGTLMHCCEDWEPVGNCFDQCSFECVDFHGLSQIIASLTRERIAEREAEILNFPWTQTEKECRLGLRAWRTKKPTLCLHSVTDEDGHSLENEDEAGMRISTYWGKIFGARVEGERHHDQNLEK